MLSCVLRAPFLPTLRRDNKSVWEDFLGHMLSLSLPLWVEVIITLLIHQNITQIQENTIKKQTQGKSASQQQMAVLFVIMQRSRVQNICILRLLLSKKGKQADPAGESTGSTTSWRIRWGRDPPVDSTVGF